MYLVFVTQANETNQTKRITAFLSGHFFNILSRTETLLCATLSWSIRFGLVNHIRFSAESFSIHPDHTPYFSRSIRAGAMYGKSRRL